MRRTTTNQEEIGARFERLRREVGLSQKEAADLLGVDQTAVSSFEIGRSKSPRIGLAQYKKLMEEWERRLGVKKESATYDDKTVTCPECTSEVPIIYQGQRMNHCGVCGEYLGIECDDCRRLNAIDARFCQYCGTPLTEEASKAARDARKAVEHAKLTKAQRIEAKKKRGEPDY